MVAVLVQLQHLKENRKNHLWQQDPDPPTYQPIHQRVYTMGNHRLVDCGQ